MENYPLEERIGERGLFTNRHADLGYFDSWVRDIEKKAAISTAIVSHRKVGKTALLQRLYNRLFERNGKVIPFLFELKEENRLLEDLSRMYYTSFISQLLSFKKREWLGISFVPEKLLEMSLALKLDYIADDIKHWQRHAEIDVPNWWTFTYEAPHRLAEISGDRFLVMIDEFQYFNKHIYRNWPENPENQITTLAGSYLGASESKIAPMLITGSIVGMLIRLIRRQLPKRFEFYFLKKFQPQDFLELGYKLSALYEVPVTDACLLSAHRLLDGHPAYLRDIFNSKFPNKDLTTEPGLYETYLFECGHPQLGRIRAGWEEYLDLALDEINQVNAKKIVLFLAKHNDREWSRKEIKEHCGLVEMNDQELERKLQALVAGDLISQGGASIDYQGLGDPTFDKVFRLKYEKEIEQSDFDLIKQDLLNKFAEENQKLKTALAAKTVEANKVRGELNQKKGEIGELWIKALINRYSRPQRYFAPGELGNNTEAIRLPRFREIGAHAFSIAEREFKLDVLCRPAQAEDSHWAVEVKNREVQKIGVKDVEEFADKLQALREIKNGAPCQGLFYSCNGFHSEAIERLQALQIFWWNFATLERLS